MYSCSPEPFESAGGSAAQSSTKDTNVAFVANVLSRSAVNRFARSTCVSPIASQKSLAQMMRLKACGYQQSHEENKLKVYTTSVRFSDEPYHAVANFLHRVRSLPMKQGVSIVLSR
jgi:hypothetical protein